MAVTRKPAPTFQAGARQALVNAQLRHNLGKATSTIRAKRTRVVEEMDDWEALSEAGRAIKTQTLLHLDKYLLELEASVSRAEGVHGPRTLHVFVMMGKHRPVS